MNGWFGDASWSVWHWWWVLPLICIALCFFRTRVTGGRSGCWGNHGDADLGRMEKEIRELKEEIGKLKERQR